MKVAYARLRQNIALTLVFLLLAPFANAAATPRRQQQNQKPANTQQQQNSQSNSQLPAAPQAANASSPPQQVHQPVGTAAAPYENPVGVAVSRPAGAAIAPAKQRRSHTFLIKMSLVVGAAVAVGTVVALSKGSPSRPH